MDLPNNAVGLWSRHQLAFPQQEVLAIQFYKDQMGKCNWSRIGRCGVYGFLNGLGEEAVDEDQNRAPDTTKLWGTQKMRERERK